MRLPHPWKMCLLQRVCVFWDPFQRVAQAAIPAGWLRTLGCQPRQARAPAMLCTCISAKVLCTGSPAALPPAGR